MKPKWRDALYAAASRGKRFDHGDDCVFFRNGKVKCKCGAGPANDALDEIAAELKNGIPVDPKRLEGPLPKSVIKNMLAMAERGYRGPFSLKTGRPVRLAD